MLINKTQILRLIFISISITLWLYFSTSELSIPIQNIERLNLVSSSVTVDSIENDGKAEDDENGATRMDPSSTENIIDNSIDVDISNMYSKITKFEDKNQIEIGKDAWLKFHKILSNVTLIDIENTNNHGIMNDKLSICQKVINFLETFDDDYYLIPIQKLDNKMEGNETNKMEVQQEKLADGASDHFDKRNEIDDDVLNDEENLEEDLEEKQEEGEVEPFRVYQHLIKLYPIPTCHSIETNDYIPKEWGCHIHNLMNQFLGKQQFNCHKLMTEEEISTDGKLTDKVTVEVEDKQLG